MLTNFWRIAMLKNVKPPLIPRPDPFPPLSVDTWLTYWVYEFELDTSLLTGYTEATKHHTDHLEELVKVSTSFTELKAELINFIKERRMFLKDVDDKWDGDQPERWGFPPHSL